MADLAALRASLTRMGFTAPAAAYLTAEDGQNLRSLASFRELDDSNVDELIKAVRKPGGTIAGDNGNQIQDPGFPVSVSAANNLKLMCYYLRNKQKTSRSVAAAEITVEAVQALGNRRKWEKEHDDAKPPELKFGKNWTRTIDIIENYLRECLGTTKIPLSYIIRDDQIPPAAATDLADSYSDITDEMAARAPHYVDPAATPLVFTQHYRADNVTVYNKIVELTRDHECWTYVKDAQRTRDGRKAFFNLKTHYLGRHNIDNLATSAEKKLATTSYNGEGRNWNFEKYVTTHVAQHSILADLVQHGYSGIDARSKVRYFLDGIRTKDLDTVKTTILASNDLRNNFDESIALFQDFIKQRQTSMREVNISAVGVGGREYVRSESSAEWGQVKPDMSVEDRYYNKQEYSKLTSAQKKGLGAKRKTRGHKTGERSSKRQRTGNGNTSGNMTQKQFQQKLVKAVATIKKMSIVSEDSSDSDDSVPMKRANRDNKALQRKKN
jgi:hypothetical protein